MCIVALKHFPNTGWIGVKNRDRNYKPSIRMVQSFREDIERLYLYDLNTKYAEGLNEFGISILSASVNTRHDEQEAAISSGKPSNKPFYSPDGKMVRKALLEKTLKSALEKCIELKLPGNTIVFDQNTAYLLEGALNVEKGNKYEHEYHEISKDKVAVRTNHGIWIPWAGYKEGKPSESSQSRMNMGLENIQKAEGPEDMLKAISSTPNKDPQLNVLRIDERRGEMRTTGQIMIIPSKLTLYYRPIYCEIEFDFNKLDSVETKTFFQIMSARDILQSDAEEAISNELLVMAGELFKNIR